MIKTVKITTLYRNTENKDKKPYVTSEGKPFKRIVIMVDDPIGKASGIDFSGWTEDWKEGDEIRLSFNDDEQYGWNFSKVGKIDELEERVEVLENLVKKDTKNPFAVDTSNQ